MTIKHVLGCPDLEVEHPEHEWISSRYGRVTCYGLTAEDVREFAHAAAIRYIESQRTVPHPPVWPNYIGRPDLDV